MSAVTEGSVMDVSAEMEVEITGHPLMTSTPQKKSAFWATSLPRMLKITCAEKEPGLPQEATPQLDDSPHFPSSQCGKKFTMSDDHHSHMNSVHLKIKPFKCEMCKRLFAHKRSLGPGRHSCRVNTEVHICGQSRKVFKSRGSPQDHARSHASMLQHIFSLRHILSLRRVCVCVIRW